MNGPAAWWLISIVASSPALLQVRVELPDGTPAPGAEVSIYRADARVEAIRAACDAAAECMERAAWFASLVPERGTPAWGVSAASDGVANVDVDAEVVHLEARHGERRAVRRVEVAAGAPARVVVSTPSAWPVHVSDVETPVSGARVVAYTRELWPVDDVSTGQDGSAVVRGPEIHSAVASRGGGRGLLQGWNLPLRLPAPRLCGEVLDGDVAVAGARVWVGTGAPPIGTDASGAFCVDLPGDDVQLVARHADRSSLPVVVSAARLHDARLWLEPGTRVTGRVVDQHGGGVGGASVEVWLARESRASRRVMGTGVTDAEGRFDVPGMPPVDLVVRARRGRDESAPAPVVPTGVTLALVPRYAVAIRVTRMGNDVPGVSVDAAQLSPGGPAETSTWVTDLHGRTTAWLPRGRFALTAGETAARARVEVPTQASVTLELGARLVEVVAVREGEPVRGARLLDSDGDEIDRTDGDGRLAFYAPPGPQLLAMTDGTQRVALALPHEREHQGPLRARFAPARRFSLEVASRGGDGAGVDVFVNGGLGPRYAGTTGADARVELALPRAERVSVQGFMPARRVAGGLAVDARMERGVLEVEEAGVDTLLLDNAGHPIPEAWRVDEGPVPTRRGMLRCSFRDRAEAPVDVGVPGMVARPTGGDLSMLRWVPAGDVVGRVLGPRGAPVSAPVDIESAGGVERVRVFAAPDGSFHARGLRAGPATLKAGGGPEVAVEVRAGAVSQPVVARVAASACWVDVAGPPGARVRGFAGGRLEDPVAMTTLDSLGVGKLGPLSAGPHHVEIEDDTGASMHLVETCPARAGEPLPARPASLELVVAADTGDPGTVASVVVQEAAQGERAPIRKGVEAPGGARVGALAPGTYWLRATLEGPHGRVPVHTLVHLQPGPNHRLLLSREGGTEVVEP